MMNTFNNILRSSNLLKDVYSLYKLGQAIIKKKSPISELDGQKLYLGLYGILIAIVTLTSALLISYFLYKAHNNPEELWIQIRSFLEIIKGYLGPIPAPAPAPTPSVSLLGVLDSKVQDVFKLLFTPGTYVSVALTMANIFDKALGVGVSFAQLVVTKPALFFGTTVTFPFARVFNILWVRDITDALYHVVTNVWGQTADALTKLSITYIEVGQSLKLFITNGIGDFVNILLIPVNVNVQLICLCFTAISKILTGISNILSNFYKTLSGGINSFIDFFRSFFGGGNSGSGNGGLGGGFGGGSDRGS